MIVHVVWTSRLVVAFDQVCATSPRVVLIIVGANLLYCTAEQRAVYRKDCGRALPLIECDDEDVD